MAKKEAKIKSKNRWSKRSPCDPNKDPKMRAKFKYDPSYLPIIQNLAALGLTEGEIGMVLGYSDTQKDQHFLESLKRRRPEVLECWRQGKKIANSKLVHTAFTQAVGYDSEEREEKYEYKIDPESGERVRILIEEKVKKKRVPGDPILIKFLLATQCGDQFREKANLEVTHKRIDGDLKEHLSREEISGFAGKLLEIAEESDTEFERGKESETRTEDLNFMDESDD